MDRVKLITSNKFKAREYQIVLQAFNEFLDVTDIDLEEVDGTPEEVILHKAKQIPVGHIVEDAIITIDGLPVVDIKWKIKELTSVQENVEFIVHIGYNDGEKIHVYRGAVAGKMLPYNDANYQSFGFDTCFVPVGSIRTLYELDKMGLKNSESSSARYRAIKNFVNNRPIMSVDIVDIPEWTGNIQGIKP